MEKIIVGIDPDEEKSGISIIKDGYISVKNYNFTTLIFNFFKELQEEKQKREVEIIIEASWLIERVYNRYRELDKLVVAKIARGVGKNQGIGKKIVECAKYYGLEIKEVVPLVGKKLTNIEISEKVKAKGLKQTYLRTNQDERDAINLILSYAVK